MPRRRALIIEAGGERFRFYYDADDPETLHITLRHGTSPEDAVRTFFEGEAQPWDQARSRFVTVTDTHGLYWTRHAHDQSVIVIACFEQEEE